MRITITSFMDRLVSPVRIRGTSGGAIVLALGILTLLICGVRPVSAQDAGAIEGRVLDRAGEPVAVAEVRLVDLSRLARTGERGEFSFAGVRRSPAPRGRKPAGGLRGRTRAGDRRAGPLAWRHGEPHLPRGGAGRDRGARPAVIGDLQATQVISDRELPLEGEASLGETPKDEPGINSTYLGSGPG